MATTAHFVVADIGGTNTRLALTRWIEDQPIELLRVVVHGTGELGDLATAMADFAGRCAVTIDGIAACAAGPIEGGDDPVIRLTNLPVSIAAVDLKRRSGVEAVVLVNDFVAQAAAAPVVGADDLVWHEHDGRLHAPCAVMGPGTGLGAATWLGGAQVLQGEGGHMALSPADAREATVFPALADEYGFVSAEDMLRGPAILRMYQALCRLDGVSAQAQNPRQVSELAFAGDALAAEVIHRFTCALGRVTGDFALCVGARSVLLAGGIVAGWGARFDVASYRKHFNAKGRFTGYMKAIPSATLTHEYPALLGLTVLAREAFEHR